MTQSENTVETLFYPEKDNFNFKRKEKDDKDIAPDDYLSVEDDFLSLDDETGSGSENSETSGEGKQTTETSSGYASSSDEEKFQRGRNGNARRNIDLMDDTISNYFISKFYEQYNVQNSSDDVKQKMLEGVTQGLPNDYSVPVDDKPEWLDMEKFRRGQAFARKYFSGVNLSQLISLFILFNLSDGLETLVFSGNSSTPFTAFKRYLSTVIRVASWYDHDIWSKGNPGYQNIKTVRSMHLNISERMKSTPFEDLKDQVTLAGSTKNSPIWNTSVRDAIQDDFKSGCLFQTSHSNQCIKKRSTFVSQIEMSFTQFGFVGLMVTFPEKFGAADASEEDLEAFLHTWRCVGYLLGIDDKYNFCNGTLKDVVARCRSLIEHWVKPSFQNLTRDWEHMSRCLVEGMGYLASTEKSAFSFGVFIMYLFWVLDIPVPRLYSTLTWRERFEFFTLKFLLTQAVKFPGVRPLLNWFLHRSISQAESLPTEDIEKLKHRKYDYEDVKFSKNK